MNCSDAVYLLEFGWEGTSIRMQEVPELLHENESWEMKFHLFILNGSMRKLFEHTNSGYSWSNRHQYYLCESEEEYNLLVEKYKDHDNGHYEYDSLIRREVWKPAYMQVSIDTLISARPQTIVSDGVAVHGGHDFKAKGITIKYCSSGLSSDYSSYDHYVKPGTIEIDNVAKTEQWWV